MPQNDLTPTRLRALIAAATPWPWTMRVSSRNVEGGLEVTISIPEISDAQILTGEQLADWENQVPNLRLLEALVNNASALADALEAKELLEWADGDNAGLRAAFREWLSSELMFTVALRAAKEAAKST